MVSRVGEWSYVSIPSAPPTTGQIRLDSSTQTAPTLLWINKTTGTDVDATNYLLGITEGQEVYIQNKDDYTKWQVYKITAPPVENSNYVEYPVAWVRGGVDLPRARVFIAFDEVPTAEAINPTFAYPSTSAFGIALGLTIRQYYAAAAAMGFIAHGIPGNLVGVLADYAFKVADSMIAYEANEKKPQEEPRPPLTPP